MRPLPAADGADPARDVAPDGTARARHRLRPRASATSQREAAVAAIGDSPRRQHAQRPTTPSLTAIYVPTPGVTLLPTLERRRVLSAVASERTSDTRDTLDLGAQQSPPQQPRQKHSQRRQHPQPHEKTGRGARRYADVDGATSAAYSTPKPRKPQLPSKRKRPPAPLDPLLANNTRRLNQQAAVAADEEARSTSSLTAAVERMESRIPLSFLLLHHHTALAERVALRAMCTTLCRHHARVRRVWFSKWLQRTVTLRVLEQVARQEVVSRHSALAHACAIVQSKVQLRLLSMVDAWKQATLRLRLVEQSASARVLQRSWRRYSLVTKFQRLAIEYRTRHRDQGATRIQALARMFLAKRTRRELAGQRHRSDAARCIQNNYRSYVVRWIAWKRRRVLASIDVQRAWRGRRGRQTALERRASCHDVVEAAFQAEWLPRALRRAVDKWLAARRIQRCSRARRFRRQVARASVLARRRRRFFPTWKIQRTWKRYRLDQVRATLSSTATRVSALFEDAARIVQHCFGVYMTRKKAVCTRRLVTLFQRFRAKRIMVDRQLQWIRQWSDAFLARWIAAVQECNPSSAWTNALLARSRQIDGVRSDQRSPLTRLRVKVVFTLMRELCEFRRTFEHAHATQIQCRWRWHRLLVLVDTMRRATLLLQRAIPPLLRLFTLRRRRTRVLARWKRERLLCLRDAIGRWKTEHLFLVHTRDLESASAKIRKAKWFRHLKLRKRMLRSWQNFVQHRRSKHSRFSCARSWHDKRLVCRSWRAWTLEAAPAVVIENVLRERGWMLHAWSALRQRRVDGLKTKRAIAWRRARVTTRVWTAWRLDLERFRLATVEASNVWDRCQRKRTLIAWSQHARAMKRVDAFHRHRASSNGVRQWILHMCLVHQSSKWKSSCDRFNSTRIMRRHWVGWRQFAEQRRAGQRLLMEMEMYHAKAIKRQAIHQWRAFAPILRDIRVTADMAKAFNAFQIERRVFAAGFRAFWAMTAGARRIAMAIIIQRAFRAKRARQKLFVLRTAIRYQISTRVNRGADVAAMNGEQLMERLRASKRAARELWVFVLLSFPWRPISQSLHESFNRAATNWTFLRKQRMGFALVDATETVKYAIRIGTDSDGGDDDLDATRHSQEGYYSLTSVLELRSSELPCIVGFWLGNGGGLLHVPVLKYTDGGIPILKRRYERVCGAHRRDSLIFSLSDGHGGSRCCSTAELMRWIETLVDDSRVASVTDLQAYARGFLARRHIRRLRALHKLRIAQRICEWIATLRAKWLVRKSNRAAIRLQRWQRGVHKRRLFWERLRHELDSYRRAARRIQAQFRRYLFFRRIHDAVQRRRTTPVLLPNAPLCGECLGAVLAVDDNDTASLDGVDCSKLTLARVACRECRQALCESCASKLHSAGKRVHHVFHTIDAPAMNEPTCAMCMACEVAKCTRVCQTCARDDTQRDGSAGNAVLTCRSCFELRHCKSHARKAALMMGSSQRKRWWWQEDAFRRHQWRVVRHDSELASVGSSSAATSAMVVDKYGWTTMNRLERMWEERAAALQSKKLRSDRLFAIRMQNEAILRDAFDRYDTDKSGAIDRREFRRMFREELCQPLSDAQVDSAMRAMDRSGNGLIEFDELLAWFAEDLLEKAQSGDKASDSGVPLALFKEALKAKRQMRRYKERLLEALPTSPMEILTKKRRQDALSGEDEKLPPTRAKVPGFPDVECLEQTDFVAKRGVFFRFVHDICGLDWVLEDEPFIPVADATEVFMNVFVPRWNAGKLTHDFYFDGEVFEFEGEHWERRWSVSSQQFEFHTRRKRTQVAADNSADHARKRKLSAKQRHFSAATAGAAAAHTTQWEDVVEWIDPRRRQQLLDAAKEAFALADRDASGYIDFREFRRLLSAELCEPLTSAQARRAFEAIDKDGSGSIDFDEFFQWYGMLKSQDAPFTRKEERARALLKTKRRAKHVAQSVVENAEAGVGTVRDAVGKALFEQQLAHEKKRGSSPELLQLMSERHAKPLALKALALHGNDTERARAWLEEKRGEQEQEAATTAAARAATTRARQQRRREARLRRRTTVAAVRAKISAAFPVSRAEKDRRAHSARLQDAVANLDREILRVERQATIRHAKSRAF